MRKDEKHLTRSDQPQPGSCDADLRGDHRGGSIQQPTLFAQKADADLAARYEREVIALLRDGAWWFRRDIVAKVPQLNERAVREIAARNRHLILSSEKGYRLLRSATVQEVHDAIARLWAMSKATAKDAVAYQRELNRKCRNSGGRAVA
jgi:hypothetical protein